MSLGTPAVNLHAPGPIGDQTPATGFFTLLSALAAATSYTAPQLAIDNSPSARGRIWTDSGPTMHFDTPDGGRASFNFDYQGSIQFGLGSGGAQIYGTSRIYAVDNGGGTGFHAGLGKFGLDGFGANGLGDGGASNTVAIVANSADIIKVTPSLMISAVPIRLPSYTVATLPAAATAGAGAKAFATDLLTPVALATVVGGGAVGYDVVSDGTNWKVG